jgi:hypothetical protein
MRSVPPVVFLSLLGLAACAPAGSSAYVSANQKLSADCSSGESSTTFISTGLYDVLSNGSDKKNCLRSYQMSLLVNSNLRASVSPSLARAEPNALQIKYADISLLDKNEGLLSFLKADKTPDGNVPNPYRVYTTATVPPSDSGDTSQASVRLDAIPSPYAEKLRAYAGDSILIEVQLFGTTTGDVDVDFSPFLYPLAICRDCLSTCRGDARWISDPELLTELNSGVCTDNRGQDDRTCIDPEC